MKHRLRATFAPPPQYMRRGVPKTRGWHRYPQGLPPGECANRSACDPNWKRQTQRDRK